MAENGLPAPTSKPGRAKTPAQTKAKALPKPSTSKTSIPLEPRVVIQPIGQQEDQDTLLSNKSITQYSCSTRTGTKSTQPSKSAKLAKSTTTTSRKSTWHNATAKSSPSTSIKLVLF